MIHPLLPDERVADLRRQNAARVLAGGEPLRVYVQWQGLISLWKIELQLDQKNLFAASEDYEHDGVDTQQMRATVEQLLDAGFIVYGAPGGADQLPKGVSYSATGRLAFGR